MFFELKENNHNQKAIDEEIAMLIVYLLEFAIIQRHLQKKSMNNFLKLMQIVYLAKFAHIHCNKLIMIKNWTKKLPSNINIIIMRSQFLFIYYS